MSMLRRLALRQIQPELKLARIVAALVTVGEQISRT